MRLFDFATRVLVLSSVSCSVDSIELEALDISTRAGNSFMYSYFSSLDLRLKPLHWHSVLYMFRRNEVAVLKEYIALSVLNSSSYEIQ